MTALNTLASQVHPRDRYLRAANLENHEEQAEHYIPTSRALEVLRRLVHSMTGASAGRSWTLTGPYGAGKSSFALFLRTLLGPAGALRDSAESALRSADAALLDDLIAARTALGAKHGFVLATTTCQQEPVADSLLRALVKGTENYWPTRKPVRVSEAIRSAYATKSARSIAAVTRAVSAVAPVLLVLDEFGKTLEHFSARASDGADVANDLFVLQELAEQATGDKASPLFMFTLQHLAFDDYVRQASAQQRREWGKVQGRFEDVSFLESAEQSLRLVAGALDDSDMTKPFAKRRRDWAKASFDSARAVGIANHLPGGADTVMRCYPLHPVALLALPELCGQLGQHGRTLFTFLASAEPGTARRFLEETVVPKSAAILPTIGLPALFDFFSGAGQAMALSIGGSRWREIHERVREAVNLDQHEVAVLKSVGLLNLMGNALGLRASADLVAFALSDPDRPADPHWRARLEDLEARGFLTFRSFADEYRLWQGSDVDLRGRVADAREQLRTTNAAELVSRLQADSPIIAARHSQEVGMLRYFAVEYTDDGSKILPTLPKQDPADGLVVYHLGSMDSVQQMSVGADRRPIVLVTSERARRVRDAAIEVAAALAVLDQQEVLDDRVARRELQDRVADARNRLSQALSDAFRPGTAGVVFRVRSGSGWGDPRLSEQSLSRLLSEVCNEAYPQSPHIRNEMLGRRDLTSQGAKARRELIEAMIEHSNEERLGLTGFGPERAMYEAVLRYTGLHSKRGDSWTFGTPGQDGMLLGAWGAIRSFINRADEAPNGVDRLYDTLMAPPIGLKEGPIPVLLVAHLLQRPDDVGIYEDGTFQPSLTVDLVERLMKSPQRFALKSFENSGSRAQILAGIAKVTVSLGVGGLRTTTQKGLRNETVLAVAAPLLNLVRGMNLYTRKTSHLSERALAVRDLLLTAREPDQLLLTDLPAACGFAGESWQRPSTTAIGEFSAALKTVLDELRHAYEGQLLEVMGWLAEAFHEAPDLVTMRKSLAARAEQIDDKVIDTKLKAFIFNVADDTTDGEGWLGRIGLAITGKSVEWWLDDDRKEFRRLLTETAASFQRVEALHADLRARRFEAGFTARRVTYTTPEGEEAIRVLYYDDKTVGALREVVAKALTDAEKVVGGPQGRDGLTAVLLDEVLRSQTQQEIGPAPSVSETKRKKISDGS